MTIIKLEPSNLVNFYEITCQQKRYPSANWSEKITTARPKLLIVCLVFDAIAATIFKLLFFL